MALLDKYRASEVEIHYLTDNNMYTDKGRILDMDGVWIELVKEGKKGETLLIPIHAVRIMKVLSVTTDPENTLLRPVMGITAPTGTTDEKTIKH